MKTARYWNQDRCRKVLGCDIHHPDAAVLRKFEELSHSLRKEPPMMERTLRRECAASRLASVVARLHYDGRAAEYRRAGGSEAKGGES